MEMSLVTSAATTPEWFLAVIRNDSAGQLQIPSSKLQAPEKFQSPNLNPLPTRCPGWPPHRSDLGLELQIWSFSGAWYLELGAFGARLIPPKTAKNLQD
jgi:hypothetical protein